MQKIGIFNVFELEKSMNASCHGSIVCVQTRLIYILSLRDSGTSSDNRAFKKLKKMKKLLKS